eukprot:5195663-Pyramimonas_sp.AAC.1
MLVSGDSLLYTLMFAPSPTVFKASTFHVQYADAECDSSERFSDCVVLFDPAGAFGASSFTNGAMNTGLLVMGGEA